MDGRLWAPVVQSLLTAGAFLGLITGCSPDAQVDAKHRVVWVRLGLWVAWCADAAQGAGAPSPLRLGHRLTSFLSGLTMKRTYQASKTRRARTHGFLVRMKTRGGRAIINARRAKGRKRLAV